MTLAGVIITLPEAITMMLATISLCFVEFQAEPSEENANQFINELKISAASAGREFFYHTVLDGDWKRLWSPCFECLGLATDTLSLKGCGFDGECEVDYNWGIFQSSGQSKSGIFA